MHTYRLCSIILLMSVIPVLVGSPLDSTSVAVTKSVTTVVTGMATATSILPATTDLTYNYTLRQTMEGGQPVWFRSCTWGEFPVIAGGTGTGAPPISFIGGDPDLRQTLQVQYWSDMPVDLYFLTHEQGLSWIYYTSLWPYQFCAPPFYGWTYGWENSTYASFTASLPAGTCPCSILIFNMNATEAHLRFAINGLGVSVDVPYQHETSTTLTDTYVIAEGASSLEVSAASLTAVGLVLVIVVGAAVWRRARLAGSRSRS